MTIFYVVFIIIGEILEIFVDESSILNIFILIVYFNGIILMRIKASFFKILIILNQIKICVNLYHTNKIDTDLEVINLIKNILIATANTLLVDKYYRKITPFAILCLAVILYIKRHRSA